MRRFELPVQAGPAPSRRRSGRRVNDELVPGARRAEFYEGKTFMLITMILLVGMGQAEASMPVTKTTGVHAAPAARVARPARVEPAPEYVSTADLLLTTRVTDDGTLVVEVFIARAADLKGYQVAVRPQVENSSQPCELLDVRIDDYRADFVFGAGVHFSATDLRQSGRLAGVLADGSVHVEAPRYLGTFVYRIPEGFAGKPDADVIADQTLLRDSRAAAIEPRVRFPVNDFRMDDPALSDEPEVPNPESSEPPGAVQVNKANTPQ